MTKRSGYSGPYYDPFTGHRNPDYVEERERWDFPRRDPHTGMNEQKARRAPEPPDPKEVIGS